MVGTLGSPGILRSLLGPMGTPFPWWAPWGPPESPCPCWVPQDPAGTPCHWWAPRDPHVLAGPPRIAQAPHVPAGHSRVPQDLYVPTVAVGRAGAALSGAGSTLGWEIRGAQPGAAPQPCPIPQWGAAGASRILPGRRRGRWRDPGVRLPAHPPRSGSSWVPLHPAPTGLQGGLSGPPHLRWLHPGGGVGILGVGNPPVHCGWSVPQFPCKAGDGGVWRGAGPQAAGLGDPRQWRGQWAIVCPGGTGMPPRSRLGSRIMGALLLRGARAAPPSL